VIDLFMVIFPAAGLAAGYAFVFLLASLFRKSHKEKKMPFSQHEQAPDKGVESLLERPASGVTATLFSPPTESEKLVHRKMREIYKLCVELGLTPPEAVTSFFGGQAICDVEDEPCASTEDVTFSVVEKKDSLSVAVELGGGRRLVLGLPSSLAAGLDPKFQPHDGNVRSDSDHGDTYWCYCTACVRARGDATKRSRTCR
jgi:hypothetical protein